MVLNSAIENTQGLKKKKEISPANSVQKSLLVTGNSRQVLHSLFRSLSFLLFFLLKIALDMSTDYVLSAFYSVLLGNLLIGLLQMPMFTRKSQCWIDGKCLSQPRIDLMCTYAQAYMKSSYI